MKKRVLSIVLGFSSIAAILYAAYVHALIPPYYQSTKEIMELLNNSEIAEKITSARMITSIARTEEGYLIVARECTLPVRIIYKRPPKGFVGPAIFEVHPGNMLCKPHPGQPFRKE